MCALVFWWVYIVQTLILRYFSPCNWWNIKPLTRYSAEIQRLVKSPAGICWHLLSVADGSLSYPDDRPMRTLRAIPANPALWNYHVSVHPLRRSRDTYSALDWLRIWFVASSAVCHNKVKRRVAHPRQNGPYGLCSDARRSWNGVETMG